MKLWIAVLIWVGSITYLSYIPSQDQFHLILPGIIGSFISYLYLIVHVGERDVLRLIILAIIARIIIIPAFPNLSDDIYRFIWDGRLWHDGIHPFLHLPTDIVGHGEALNNELFSNLNSKEYYSIYPPIPQLLFWLSTVFMSNDLMSEVFIIKTIHVLFDVGSIYFLYRLLSILKMDHSKTLWYAMNPLIVIELINNLHHEGLVIFFILVFLFFIQKKNLSIAAISFAGAIASKILPGLFLPATFFYLDNKERWKFLGITVLASCLIFIPFLSSPGVFQNLMNSADLYFRKFEFNASIYYFFRWLGYLIYEYNIIHSLGPVLSGISMILIIGSAFLCKGKMDSTRSLIHLLLFSFTAYLVFATTIHPWYVTILIPLSLFTNFKFPIIWSFLIMLTYINYSYEPYRENFWIVGLEYLIVGGILILEIFRSNRTFSTIPDSCATD